MEQKMWIKHGAERVYNVKQFGAIGDGVHDDTDPIRQAAQAAEQGGVIFFPRGDYRVTGAVEISGDGTCLCGEGRQSRIVYTYEQQESDTEHTASLFVFAAQIRDVRVEHLQLVYTGSFFPKFGESYKGKINGLLFRQCFDVRIEQVEASGFNASAVKVATGDAQQYASRFAVSRCYLHHNRVAGVLYGYVEDVSITDCDLNDNGSIEDGGTGYGCAGSSQELPRNIQIIGNRANGNFRKGIDLHAGVRAIIEGNLCHGNRLYGIHAEGVKTGYITIRGNIISGMSRQKLDISEPYTWICGIDFGAYLKGDEPLAEDDHFTYIIEGNQIVDFGLEEGNAYPIRCYNSFRQGMVQIKNNIFKLDVITHWISTCNPSSDTAGETWFDVSGNQVTVRNSTSTFCLFRQCSMIMLNGNTIRIQDVLYSQPFLELQRSHMDKVIMTNNMIDSLNPASKQILFAKEEHEPLEKNFDPEREQRRMADHVVISDNL